MQKMPLYLAGLPMNTKLKITAIRRTSTEKRTLTHSEFEALIAKQEKRLRNFILKHFRDDNAVEDIFQQTLIEAYCSWDSFRGDARRATWLFGIALNVIRNIARRSPQYRFNFTTDEELEHEEADDADPLNHCMKNEFSIKLESALDKLPQELKDTLALVIEDGKTYQETANILSIPIGTVRSRISRSRAQLKLLYDLYID